MKENAITTNTQINKIHILLWRYMATQYWLMQDYVLQFGNFTHSKIVVEWAHWRVQLDMRKLNSVLIQLTASVNHKVHPMVVKTAHFTHNKEQSKNMKEKMLDFTLHDKLNTELHQTSSNNLACCLQQGMESQWKDKLKVIVTKRSFEMDVADTQNTQELVSVWTLITACVHDKF